MYILRSDASSMFHFMEGMLIEGANTVYNLLYHALRFELQKKCCNRIFFYFDAARLQKINYLMVLILSMFSEKYKVFIEDLYPFRSHLDREYDRNFGRYGQEKKCEK